MSKKNKITHFHTNKVTQLSTAGEKPTIGELQEMVGGHIQLVFDSSELALQIVVDEEGKLKGKSMNDEATIEWYRLLSSNKDKSWYSYEEFISQVDWLAGDVVFLHNDAMLD